MPDSIKQIHRGELYRRVCATPLSKLAPELGISPPVLAGLCRDHQVPYPGSGYWTRKSLGLATELVPLPALEVGEGSGVILLPQRKPTRARRAQQTTQLTSSVLPQAEAKEALVVVPDKLVRPHPLIAEWIEHRNKRRREALRSGESWRIRNAPDPWSELETRGHRILDAIFRAVEARGGSISEGYKGRACATIDGQKIEFLIREKNKQVNLRADDDRRSYRSTELIGTGRLVLGIKTYLRGRHNEEWNETDAKPLETAVTAFVERLFEGAENLKAWALEREQDRLLWAEEAARSAELERQRADNEARQAKLTELGEHWHAAQRLEGMLDAVLAGSHDPAALIGERTVQEWVEWARAIVADLKKPTASVDALFRAVSQAKAGHRYG